MGKIPRESADEMIKHWLLNLAVEHPVWLGCLFPAVDAEGLNVKPLPRCKALDYARGLLELLDAGMIKLSSEVSGDDVESGLGAARVLDRFVRLSNDDPALCRGSRLLPMYERNPLPGMQVEFELTPRGGEAWERVAEPDWSRLFTVSRDSTSGELISPDRDLLMALMGWYSEIHHGETIQRDTIRWQTHTDYAILYWKRVPLVCHASFGLQAAEAPWPGWGPEWFRDWYFSAVSWHRKPWDLPGWPPESQE